MFIVTAHSVPTSRGLTAGSTDLETSLDLAIKPREVDYEEKPKQLLFIMTRLLSLWILFFLTSTAQTQNINDASCQKTNQTILKLYQQIKHEPRQRFQQTPDRIIFFSKQFLGKPYALTSLGEGINGYFDQAPLYRTDAFDCETYVDTVLALAFGHDLPSFKSYMRKIRYRDGRISLFDRNHFTCLDWNQNNQKQQMIQDITTEIRDQNHHNITEKAAAYIDKPNWYQHFSIDSIRLQQGTSDEKIKRLNRLKQQAKLLPKTISTLDYIPFTALFSKTGQANAFIFNQIPQGAIIEIVRPNWNLTKEIGTHLNVSHLGFAIWEQHILYFFEATSKAKQVVKIPLINYLREAQSSPTIKGINIQVAK